MKRTFKLNEFAFTPSDLDSPGALLATLGRMDPTQINTPGYASQLYQAVTNQGNFDSDSWFDISFEICSRQDLQDFSSKLASWHQEHAVKQLFLPNILADSAINTPWVKEDLENMGILSQASPQKINENIVQTSFTNMSL